MGSDIFWRKTMKKIFTITVILLLLSALCCAGGQQDNSVVLENRDFDEGNYYANQFVQYVISLGYSVQKESDLGISKPKRWETGPVAATKGNPYSSSYQLVEYNDTDEQFGLYTVRHNTGNETPSENDINRCIEAYEKAKKLYPDNSLIANRLEKAKEAEHKRLYGHLESKKETHKSQIPEGASTNVSQTSELSLEKVCKYDKSYKLSIKERVYLAKKVFEEILKENKPSFFERDRNHYCCPWDIFISKDESSKNLEIRFDDNSNKGNEAYRSSQKICNTTAEVNAA
jgi:hypothetical protein